MTSGWPQDQRDRRWPAASSDDTGPETRRRGRLATETGPQTPVPSDGTEFGSAHPSGPLPVGPMPQPRGRRGRSREDGTDSYGLSDADYDWIRYLGEAGPAQGTTTKDRPADTGRPARTPAALPQRRGMDRRPDEPPSKPDSTAPRSAPPRSTAPQSAAPDAATGIIHRSHRRPAGPSPREAAPAPWTAERGWPTSSPASDTPRPTESLTRTAGGPVTRPVERPPARPVERPAARPVERPIVQPGEHSVVELSPRSLVRPAERSIERTPAAWPAEHPVERTPAAWPAERPSGPAQRPDDSRVRGSGRAGAAHRRVTAAVETSPETARSAVQEGRPGLRSRRDARRSAVVEQAAAPATRSVVAAVAAQPVTKDTAVTGPIITQPKAAPAKRTARAKARRRHRTLIRVIALIGAVAVLPAAAAGVLRSGLFRSSGGPGHSITVPPRLLAFSLEPGLAKGMNAQALRANIVNKGKGEAKNVVDGVYEDNAVSGTKSSPLIVLFIGGNLSGSASSFINSFTGMLPGAFTTSAGKLGGVAACVPGTSGRPAECAWADNDTFGLFASPALSAATLGKDMRSMRPLVEHRAKKA